MHNINNKVMFMYSLVLYIIYHVPTMFSVYTFLLNTSKQNKTKI